MEKDKIIFFGTEEQKPTVYGVDFQIITSTPIGDTALNDVRVFKCEKGSSTIIEAINTAIRALETLKLNYN